jgi:hypothetical protein
MMNKSHLISKLNVTGIRLLKRLTLLSDTFTTLASLQHPTALILILSNK